MDNYVFRKSRTIHLRQCYKNVDAIQNPAVDVVCLTKLDFADGESQNLLCSETDNTNDTTTALQSASNNNEIVAGENSRLNVITVGVDEYDSTSFSSISNIGDIIDLSSKGFLNDSTTLNEPSTLENTPQSNVLLADALLKEVAKLNAKIDSMISKQEDLQNEFTNLNAKVDSMTSKQEGFQKVIVDLAYKVLSIEECFSPKTVQQAALSLELSIPMSSEESFKLNEAALATQTTADNLVILYLY